MPGAPHVLQGQLLPHWGPLLSIACWDPRLLSEKFGGGMGSVWTTGTSPPSPAPP